MNTSTAKQTCCLSRTLLAHAKLSLSLSLSCLSSGGRQTVAKLFLPTFPQAFTRIIIIIIRRKSGRKRVGPKSGGGSGEPSTSFIHFWSGPGPLAAFYLLSMMNDVALYSILRRTRMFSSADVSHRIVTAPFSVGDYLRVLSYFLHCNSSYLRGERRTERAFAGLSKYAVFLSLLLPTVLHCIIIIGAVTVCHSLCHCPYLANFSFLESDLVNCLHRKKAAPVDLILNRRVALHKQHQPLSIFLRPLMMKREPSIRPELAVQRAPHYDRAYGKRRDSWLSHHMIFWGGFYETPNWTSSYTDRLQHCLDFRQHFYFGFTLHSTLHDTYAHIISFLSLSLTFLCLEFEMWTLPDGVI